MTTLPDMGSMLAMALAVTLAQANVQQPTATGAPAQAADQAALQQQVDQLQAQVNALQGQVAEDQAALAQANDAAQAANAELERRAQAAQAQDAARVERAGRLREVHVALGQLGDELNAGSSDVSDSQAAALAQFQAVSASAHASGSEREAFFADDAIRTLQQISQALDRQGYLDAQLLLARVMWDANQGTQAALSSPPASAPFETGPSP